MREKSVLGLCAGLATVAVADRLVAGAVRRGEFTRWAEALLVDDAGKPLAARGLETAEALVFAYPYVSTPCFLMNLGAAASPRELSRGDGVSYRWPGGVGPAASLVAYSAICAHQLAYPSRQRSAISYASGANRIAGRSRVIVCCAHHSVYDPASGAAVLSGPAPQRLATVVLRYEPATQTLSATGILGAALFDDFFVAYREQLVETYGPGQWRRKVEGRTVVTPLSRYSKEVVSAAGC